MIKVTKRNIFNKWFRKQKVTEKDFRRREDIDFLVNTGPIWSVKEEGWLQNRTEQKSKTLELRGRKERKGHKEVA